MPDSAGDGIPEGLEINLETHPLDWMSRAIARLDLNGEKWASTRPCRA